MSKKNFIELADCLKRIKPVAHSITEPSLSAFADGKLHGEFVQWQTTVDTLADFCQSQHPAFNRERWLGYIAGTNGPGGGAVKK